jgi:hypothetical protein
VLMRVEVYFFKPCNDLLQVAIPAELVNADFSHILESFRKCLALRDKYTAVSCQRLGDNPRDHDGFFKGFNSDVADVAGVRPDVDLTRGDLLRDKDQLPPWQIRPRPPPPHWHWSPTHEMVHRPLGTVRTESDDELEQDMQDSSSVNTDGWDFQIDDRGVFQVYANVNGLLLFLVDFVVACLTQYYQLKTRSQFSISLLFANTSWTWTTC